MDTILYFNLKDATPFQKHSLNLFKDLLECLKSMEHRIQKLDGSKKCKMEDCISSPCHDYKLFYDFSWVFNHLSAMLIRSCFNYKLTDRELNWQPEFMSKLMAFADSGDATFIPLLESYDTWLKMYKTAAEDHKVAVLLSTLKEDASSSSSLPQDHGSLESKKNAMDTSEDLPSIAASKPKSLSRAFR